MKGEMVNMTALRLNGDALFPLKHRLRPSRRCSLRNHIHHKTLRAKVGTEIYVKAHRLEPYYVAALAAYKLELQYRSQKIAANYKPARYHLLLAARLLMD